MQTLVSWFIALLLLLVAVAGSTLPLAAISYFGLPFLAALPFGGLLSLLAAALMIGIYLWLFLYLVEHALNLGSAGRGARLLLMMVMNLRRNMVRTALSYAATVVLVFVVTVIWTILTILNAATKEKTQDLKAIVTERWQLPSQMPYPYFKEVKDHLPELASENVMSWQFYGGSTVADASKRNRENMLFLFALEPDMLINMMEELEDLRKLPKSDPKRANFEAALDKMKQLRSGVILGTEKLKALKLEVGSKFKVYSLNYKDIDLEFEVVGTFPEGRYNQAAAMNGTYLLTEMEKYMSTKGEPHPLYHRTLNLIWIRVPDREKFEQSAGTLMNSTSFKTPAIKCETASSGISTFLDAYKDLLRIFHILGYAILLILVLVVANAISIGVRERMTEMAVLKVLGFQPWQILAMVLGEAMLLGMVGGFLSSGFTYWIVNFVMNGIRFPIAFFGAFFVPTDALWWGVVLGGLTSFFGSVIPAWNACAVKVSEIFARVA